MDKYSQLREAFDDANAKLKEMVALARIGLEDPLRNPEPDGVRPFNGPVLMALETQIELNQRLGDLITMLDSRVGE